ncbi:Taurine catabolism dioxygenase [Neofusicoccum parvum]|uniref:Taurine catabolism dioxygenase n=1 Tax=Neofusicoccum parvum TaxID=310453 RepID=A0ACB5SMF4_9PEZI|nr:Taurine catabolism dioxygenase [Neofusicoccum parvum]
MTSHLVFAPSSANLFSGQCVDHSVRPAEIDNRPGTARGNPPRGFPQRLKSELCWKPSDFKDHTEKYIVHLNEEDLKAVMEAVAAFKSRGLQLPFLEPSTFPLPESLTRRLRQVSKIVHSGIGFAVLRGLNPAKHSEIDSVIAYCGIASHIGAQRSTNSKGNAMDHIRNASRDVKPEGLPVDQELAPSKLPDGMKFHADRMYADVISLLVKSQAAVGGEQYISSSWTLYNELLEQAPEDLQVLAEDWQWALPDQLAPEAPNKMPALLHADGRVMLQLVWQPFVKNPELATPRQLRALGTVQRLAEQNAIRLDQRPGDIQLINNLAVLHTRAKFEDSPDQKRHLLRLGLRDPAEAWRLPERYAALFEDAFATPVDAQNIPVTDFDAWDKTTTEDANHG